MPDDENRVREIAALLAPLPIFCTAADMSAALSVSVRTIADETRRGRLRGSKLGRSYVYTHLDIARWFVERENGFPAKKEQAPDPNFWGRSRRARPRD